MPRERRIAELRADIAALDRAMALMDPDHVIAPRKRAREESSLFARGELRSFVLGLIRESTGAVTAHDLSERLLTTKRIAADDR